MGYQNADDAGVYQLTPDLSLVQTVDFFSPIVDDAYTYGQIAAANALSDVYAMGGEPKTALSIVGFPATGVGFSVLGDIMRGGLDKLAEARVALLGGHSVRDDEIKFGYAVTGVVENKNIKENAGARPGDRLILTKPLGTGLITTALKRERAAAEHVQGAVRVMVQLNRDASRIALAFNVNAMTDITGFGLLGHAMEVAQASGISLQIDHGSVPVLEGALEYSRAGFCAGGLVSNRDFFGPRIVIHDNVPQEIRNVLFDPQTSGGLLIFCPASAADPLLQKLRSERVEAVGIGLAAEPSSAGAARITVT